MANKRGQEAAGDAAGLIIFVGFILIVYLLLLQPKDRAELLGDNTTNGSNGGSSWHNITTLLSESPGSLFPNEQKSFEHPISQVVLSAMTQDTVLAEKPSLYIMASKLDKKSETMSFDAEIEDREYSALILSMYVKSAAGRLIIRLNGEEVFNGELETGVGTPIRMGGNLIKEKNYLEFSVPNVPWYRFWARNQYEMRDIQLIASMKKTDTMEAINTFTLSGLEVSEFQSGYIRFTVECEGKQKGLLKVFLNGNLMSSSVPDCQGYEKIDIANEDIEAGKNEIMFSLGEGTIYLTSITTKIEIKQPRWPIYYFEMNASTWKRVADLKLKAFMQAEFVDENQDREAEININQRKFYMDTTLLRYKKDITSYLREGSNFISLIPSSELNIATLKLFIEED